MKILDPCPELIVTVAAFAFLLQMCKEFLARNKSE